MVYIHSTTLQDFFDIIFVNHEACQWNTETSLSPAESNNIEIAIAAVKKFESNGGTDILKGFRKAFDVMSSFIPCKKIPK